MHRLLAHKELDAFKYSLGTLLRLQIDLTGDTVKGTIELGEHLLKVGDEHSRILPYPTREFNDFSFNCRHKLFLII